MKNYVQKGDVINYIPTTDIKAGDLIQVGGIVGVVAADTPAASKAVLYTEGVFSFNKESSEVFEFGDKIFYDSLAKVLTKVSNEFFVGISWSSQISGDIHGFVKLNESTPISAGQEKSTEVVPISSDGTLQRSVGAHYSVSSSITDLTLWANPQQGDNLSVFNGSNSSFSIIGNGNDILGESSVLLESLEVINLVFNGINWELSA